VIGMKSIFQRIIGSIAQEKDHRDVRIHAAAAIEAGLTSSAIKQQNKIEFGQLK
jgi:hypothetical protein